MASVSFFGSYEREPEPTAKMSSPTTLVSIPVAIHLADYFGSARNCNQKSYYRLTLTRRFSLTLMQPRLAPADASRTLPVLRVNPQNRSCASRQIDEAAVIADFAITKQPCQHRQRVLGDG